MQSYFYLKFIGVNLNCEEEVELPTQDWSNFYITLTSWGQLSLIFKTGSVRINRA